MKLQSFVKLLMNTILTQHPLCVLFSRSLFTGQVTCSYIPWIDASKVYSMLFY